MAKDYPNLRLDFIGSPKSGSLDKLIDTLGVRDKIDFHSKLSIEKMVSLYQKATDSYRPIGLRGLRLLPAVEAMACGTPVVSTVGGSLGEIVGDAGLLAPIRDPQALASQAGKLLSNESTQHAYSAQGLDRVQKNFTWEKAATRLDTYYKEIPANKLVSLETIRLSELALNKESLLLDVGSGEGRHSISAHLISDAVIFGLDANHGDLLTAKSRLDEFQISAQKRKMCIHPGKCF